LYQDSWYNYKVIPEQGDPEKSLSSSKQYTKTKEIFNREIIFSSRVTRGRRHAGVMEAETLGIPLDTIKRGGG
jgi:hypothetical protein